ncbi:MULTISPECIES: hypothetical protein [unclassified Methylobacterium]|uniref:hypothetical protein n=1 Tax=unclassified Methylobacterium TaxID=2615210 RepID=UPI000152E7D7|nr:MULTISPECIES: hypothetical protein [Methylobacterium]WFT77942.1 hypothetical protein QA634_21900 [Methylobacterium nodulans]
MRTGLWVVASLAVLASSGCVEFGYVSQTYASLRPQVVTIGCNDPYEVFDERQTRRMLIVSNGLREVAGCGLDGADPALTRRKRFRDAAVTYLSETDRETCRITAETVFDDLRTEFAYACAEPVEKPGTKVRRLPGRT